MKSFKLLFTLLLSSAACGLLSGQMLFDGDGSNESGFVAPIQGAPPPAPRASISSAETFIPGGAPVVPQARSEKKNMPKPPVMFTKMSTERGRLDWATRPNDLNNLLKSMAEMIDVHYSMEIKSIGEISSDPTNNPIIYRTGHFHFEFSPAERAKLREYLLNGGMIIFNAGMGSKPFYDSAVREMNLIFPEVGTTRLEPDHPVFHSYYDISQVQYRQGVRDIGFTDNTPWLDAVVVECRAMVLISRWGMDIGWDALDDDSLLGYKIEDAKKLGINIMSYATAQQAWLKDLTRGVEFIDSEDAGGGAMQFAQIIYNGDWKTRHAGLSVLLHQFNQRTEVPVKFSRREIRLTDQELFDMPMVYMTGHSDFRLTEEEVIALRQYLSSGGLLFAEACCGRAAFDVAFRRELNRVLPGQNLARLASSNIIFNMPNQVAQVGLTPALQAKRGEQVSRPELLGVQAGPAFAVIYSPLGMAGGWELAQDPYAMGLDNASSLQLGTNILMYAITQ